MKRNFIRKICDLPRLILDKLVGEPEPYEYFEGEIIKRYSSTYCTLYDFKTTEGKVMGVDGPHIERVTLYPGAKVRFAGRKRTYGESEWIDAFYVWILDNEKKVIAEYPLEL